MHIVQSEFESTLTYQVFNPRTVPFSFLFAVWMKATFGITSIFLHNFATIFFATVQVCGEGTSRTESTLFAASVLPLCLNLNKPLHVVTSLAVVARTQDGFLGEASGSTAEALATSRYHWSSVKFATNQMNDGFIEGHDVVVKIQKRRIGR